VCEAELSAGKLNRAEIDLVRLLVRRNLDVNILFASDLGRKLVIVVRGDSGKIRDLWKDYVVFEDTDVDVEKLFAPVKLRKTRVFLPDGTEGERFIVSRSELRSAGFKLPVLEKALEKLSSEKSVRLI